MTDREERLQEFIDMQKAVRDLEAKVSQLERTQEESDVARLITKLNRFDADYYWLTHLREAFADHTQSVKSYDLALRQELLKAGVGIDLDQRGPTTGDESTGAPGGDLRRDDSRTAPVT